MSVSFSDLQYFKMVSELGTLTRAAQRLGITQPGLTQSMKRLEEAFGIPLLERGQRGVRLTPAGKVLHQKIGRFMEDWEALHSEILRGAGEPRGKVELSCHTSLSTICFPEFVPTVATRFPEITLSVRNDTSRKNTEAVIYHESDLAIVANPLRHPDLVIRHLYFDFVGFYTHGQPDLPAAVRDPDLIVLNTAMPQCETLLREASARLGWAPTRQFELGHLEAIAQVVAAGVGVGILPESLAKRFALAPVAKSPRFRDEICLIYRKENLRSRAVECVIEIIREVWRK